MGRSDTIDRERSLRKVHSNLASHQLLRVIEKRFNAAHRRLEELTFVQELTVPEGELVLEVQLPLREGMLLQSMVRLDGHQCGRGLKGHTPLDAQDRIAHVHITSDVPVRADVVESTQQRYRVHRLTIQARGEPLFKVDHESP